jgi:hypothetical protein
MVTEAEAAEVQPLAEDVTVYVPAGAVTNPVEEMVTPAEGTMSYVLFASKLEMAKLPVATAHVGWVTFPRTTGTAGV